MRLNLISEDIAALSVVHHRNQQVLIFASALKQKGVVGSVCAHALTLSACSVPDSFDYLSRQLKKMYNRDATIKGTEI